MSRCCAAWPGPTAGARIRQLPPLDRHVMLQYLEQADAAPFADITGLSAANVATKVHRIKQILRQRFLNGTSHGQQS